MEHPTKEHSSKQLFSFTVTGDITVNEKLEEKEVGPNFRTIALIGRTGAGKSTLLNGLLQRKCATEAKNLKPTTANAQFYDEEISGTHIRLIDYEGFSDCLQLPQDLHAEGVSEAQIEKRNSLVARVIPQLAYCSSNVIIYVTEKETASSRDAKEIMKLFSCDATNRAASCLPPTLIFVFNKQTRDYTSFYTDASESTRSFHNHFGDEENKDLAEKYSHVHCIRLPDKGLGKAESDPEIFGLDEEGDEDFNAENVFNAQVNELKNLILSALSSTCSSWETSTEWRGLYSSMIQRVHQKKEVRIEELKIEATSDYRSRASSVSTGSDLASDSDYAVDYGRPRLFPPAKADYIRTKSFGLFLQLWRSSKKDKECFFTLRSRIQAFIMFSFLRKSSKYQAEDVRMKMANVLQTFFETIQNMEPCGELGEDGRCTLERNVHKSSHRTLIQGPKKSDTGIIKFFRKIFNFAHAVTWPGEFRALSDGLADYQKRMETCLAEEINKLGKDQLINAEELHLALLLEMKAQSTAKNSPRGVCFLCEKKSPTSLISFPCGHKDFCQSCRDTVRKVFVSNRQIMDAIGYSRCEYNDSCPQCNFWPDNLRTVFQYPCQSYPGSLNFGTCKPFKQYSYALDIYNSKSIDIVVEPKIDTLNSEVFALRPLSPVHIKRCSTGRVPVVLTAIKGNLAIKMRLLLTIQDTPFSFDITGDVESVRRVWEFSEEELAPKLLQPIYKQGGNKVYNVEIQGESCAVKQIDRSLDSFKNEMNVAGHFIHENIEEIIGYCAGPNLRAVVTKFRLCSLEDAIADRSVEQLREVISLEIAQGMAYLHDQNYMHRDLKPANCLVISKNASDPCHVKITDFGTVKSFSHLRSQTMPVGTHAYAAPEVVLTNNYGLEIDVFSYGKTLVHLWTGLHPDHEDANNLINVHDDIKQIIVSCLQSDPKQRPTFIDIVKQLQKMINGAE